MLHKVTFNAIVEIDVWVEADDSAHAQSLVEANSAETYGRVKSSLAFNTGAIRINTPSIVVQNVTLDE